MTCAHSIGCPLSQLSRFSSVTSFAAILSVHPLWVQADKPPHFLQFKSAPYPLSPPTSRDVSSCSLPSFLALLRCRALLRHPGRRPGIGEPPLPSQHENRPRISACASSGVTPDRIGGTNTKALPSGEPSSPSPPSFQPSEATAERRAGIQRITESGSEHRSFSPALPHLRRD